MVDFEAVCTAQVAGMALLLSPQAVAAVASFLMGGEAREVLLG